MIGAILLAAGRSRRMGTQKLLLPFAGGTVIAHIAGQILASRVSRTLAVIGTHDARVAEALRGLDVQIVTNRNAEGDMLSSVRCGLRALDDACEAALVALGDQPSVTADLIDRMIAAWERGGCGIVVPAYQGRRGHPILLARRHFEEILCNLDGVGLRGLIERHGRDVRDLPTDQPSVLHDMDRPEDYRRELHEHVTDPRDLNERDG